MDNSSLQLNIHYLNLVLLTTSLKSTKYQIGAFCAPCRGLPENKMIKKFGAVGSTKRLINNQRFITATYNTKIEPGPLCQSDASSSVRRDLVCR